MNENSNPVGILGLGDFGVWISMWSKQNPDKSKKMIILTAIIGTVLLIRIALWLVFGE